MEGEHLKSLDQGIHGSFQISTVFSSPILIQALILRISLDEQIHFQVQGTEDLVS